jgi:hypothetical protein
MMFATKYTKKIKEWKVEEASVHMGVPSRTAKNAVSGPQMGPSDHAQEGVLGWEDVHNVIRK